MNPQQPWQAVPPPAAPYPGPPPGPYGPYGPYAPVAPTNSLALAALLCGIFVAPVGIVLGIMARKQIRQTGEQGDGMALAGLIIGAAQTAIIVLVFAIWLVVMLMVLGTVATTG
ncbi:DUF4190 domain-containing protein [Actinomycetospora sp. OC33-EN08]|uniref:DUF4190 domain-containing protein n=1 Tax=Actinomycetospora aurantiaca TaxID=3129233 RepID=A0ABU8MT38_9PSEU